MLHFNTKGVDKHIRKIYVNGKTVPMLILSPLDKPKNAPGVLWIHGGGYATGFKEMAYMSRAIDLVKNHGAVVVAPGYHLSLFHPYPTALNDYYRCLFYMLNHASELGINSNQIAIGGESAGGGLTAALTMLARDKGEINIAFQMPLYPMIDNFDTESSRDNHAKVWNTRRNHMAWKLYLRKDWNNDVSPYAAPARQTNFSNLPPTYTFVCTAEPFYQETLTYIQHLKDANVEANCNVYKGMYHAFDMMEPENPTSLQAIEDFNKFFEYAKEHYFASNKGY